MTVLRIFRLLRIFKLSRSFKNFSFFLETMASTVSKIVSLATVLLIFIFMYAIAGMQLFSNKLRFDYKNQPILYFTPLNDTISANFSYPDSNFDTFPDAVISVFIVLAGGWTNLFFDTIRASESQPYLSYLFFISLIIFGQMIIFNLFLSTVLREFEQRGFILE